MKMQNNIVKLTASLLLLTALSGCFGGKTGEEDVTTDKGIAVENQPKIETTASGLQYIILAPAQDGAASPEKGDKLTMHYTGWLYDEKAPENKGRKFDSSVDRKQPFSFNIGKRQVIAGWDEGVISMKKGEKRRLIIPADLGYGSRGAGAIIPGNATLVFDVELLDINN